MIPVPLASTSLAGERAQVNAVWVCFCQILKELEGLHSSAAEQLEGLYEARLALEKEKLRQMAAAKDDLELSLKVSRISTCCCFVRY